MSNKFALLDKDVSGGLRVRAVVEWNNFPKNVPGAYVVVKLKEGEHPSRVLGSLYINGEFVRRDALAKRDRKERLASSTVAQIVWLYRDFGWGNSLSHVSRETVRWLQRNNVPVKVLRWGGGPVPDFPNASFEELPRSAVIVMDRYPPPENVWNVLGEAPLVAGYYMLEGTRARDDEVVRLEGYDTVFTPSEFCRKALVESGISVPIHVWGHGIDPEVFPYVPPKPDRPFTFLWFGDENRRKGYDLFLEAFSRLKVPNIRAWVRGPGSGNIAHLKSYYQKDRRIVWDTRVTPPDQLKEMMAEADVIVSPHRGEGFGLCMLEAMASGRPAIATRWSGPLDFGGGDDLTYWIDPSNWEPSQNDAGIQAVPSVESLVEAMKRCAENPEEVLERGLRVSRHVHAKWRWGEKVMEVIPVLRKLAPRCMI